MQIQVINLNTINDLLLERSLLIDAAASGDEDALERFNELGQQAAELARSGEGVTTTTFEVPIPKTNPEQGR